MKAPMLQPPIRSISKPASAERPRGADVREAAGAAAGEHDAERALRQAPRDAVDAGRHRAPRPDDVVRARRDGVEPAGRRAAPVTPTSTSSQPLERAVRAGRPRRRRRRRADGRTGAGRTRSRRALPPSSRITNPFAFSASSRMTANDRRVVAGVLEHRDAAPAPERHASAPGRNRARSASPIVSSANTLGLVLLGSRPPLSCSCRASSRETPRGEARRRSRSG